MVHPIRSLFVIVTLCFSVSILLAEEFSQTIRTVTAFAESEKSILVLGDSLSAGYGIPIEQSWPALMQKRLEQLPSPYIVHNASISGQTSAEGLVQIDALLARFHPDLMILELGANDGLRGLSLSQMEKNLSIMITKAQHSNAKVLLIGMRIPSNYGLRYTESFHSKFNILAKQHNTAYLPFLMESLIGKADFIQKDGLHPTAEAQLLILDYVWPSVEQFIFP